MKRVLLGSMTVGGGHNALRDSFAASLRAVDPDAQTFETIIFDSTDTQVSRFYEATVHMATWFQGLIFEMGKTNWGVRLSVLLNRYVLKEAKEALLKHRPDVVVCTHFLLSMMFAKARRDLEMDVTVVNAIPDYGDSVLAFYPDAADIQPDYVIAMDRKTHQHLIEVRGVPAARTHLSGFMPRQVFLDVSSEFTHPGRLPSARRAALLCALKAEHPQLSQLDPAKKTLVFLGGSAWTSKTLPVIERLLEDPEYLDTVNVVVVSGKNEEFLSSLRARVAGNERFSLFGFVSPKLMAQLVAIADLPVLGSLAPASMHELLEMRCGPLMLFHIIPGAEEPHPVYIRDHRVGLYEPDAEAMVELLRQATGFKPAGPQIAQLLASFEDGARSIRADHAFRARQLGAFLAHVGRVVPLQAPRTGDSAIPLAQERGAS